MRIITKLAAVAALVVMPCTASAQAVEAPVAPESITAPVEAAPVDPAEAATEAPATPIEAPAEAPAPAEPAAAATPSGPAVVIATRNAPPSLVMSRAGPMALGLAGALIAIKEGKDIVETYRLQDPSNVVALEVAKAFAAKKGAQVVDAPVVVVDKKTDLVAGNTTKAAYIVDINPVGMNAIYFSLDWSHYGLLYTTKGRILDGATGKVVATGKCFVKPVKSDASPSYDELMVDQASGLKKLIDEATAACVTQMIEKMAF